jgi:hypothetical protein
VYVGSDGLLRELDATSGSPTSFDPGANEQIRALLPGPNGTLYVGGDFTGMGPVPQAAFAELAPQ